MFRVFVLLLVIVLGGLFIESSSIACSNSFSLGRELIWAKGQRREAFVVQDSAAMRIVRVDSLLTREPRYSGRFDTIYWEYVYVKGTAESSPRLEVWLYGTRRDGEIRRQHMGMISRASGEGWRVNLRRHPNLAGFGIQGNGAEYDPVWTAVVSGESLPSSFAVKGLIGHIPSAQGRPSAFQ